MPRARTTRSLLLLLFLFASPPAAPQTLAFPQLHQRAGIVFAGTVTHIQAGAQQVQITFRVDQGIRGVAGKRTVTIREWAGLWTLAPRYRIGERLVLFLYPPGSAGLTSPVGGTLGRLPIDDRNRIIVPRNWAPGGRTASSTVPKPGASTFRLIQNGVPHPSAEAEGAPLRLTVKQFTQLVRRAAE